MLLMNGASALAIFGAGHAYAQTAALTDLGKVSTSQDVQLFATAISGNGQTVIGYGYPAGISPAANYDTGFYWTQAGGLVELSGVGNGRPSAVNYDGTMIAGQYNSQGFIVDTTAGTITTFGSGYPISILPTGLSRDGSIVIGSEYAPGHGGMPEAFKRTASAGITLLGYLPGGDSDIYRAPPSSQARGISGDGTVIVGSSTFASQPANFGAVQAFRYTDAGGMVGIGFLDGSLTFASSTARGISDDGTVIAGSSTVRDPNTLALRTQAFRWTAAGGMAGLGYVDGGGGTPYSYVNGINGDGSIIVGSSSSPAAPLEGFRWAATGPHAGMQSLAGLLTQGDVDLTGFSALIPTGISVDGQFMSVNSVLSDGNYHGFLVRYIDGGSPLASHPVTLDFPTAPAPRSGFGPTVTTALTAVAPLAGGQVTRMGSLTPDGSTLVGTSTDSTTFGTQGFRWTAAGGTVGLGYLYAGGRFSNAAGISDDGLSVVGASDFDSASATNPRREEGVQVDRDRRHGRPRLPTRCPDIARQQHRNPGSAVTATSSSAAASINFT